MLTLAAEGLHGLAVRFALAEDIKWGHWTHLGESGGAGAGCYGKGRTCYLERCCIGPIVERAASAAIGYCIRRHKEN